MDGNLLDLDTTSIESKAGVEGNPSIITNLATGNPDDDGATNLDLEGNNTLPNGNQSANDKTTTDETDFPYKENDLVNIDDVDYTINSNGDAVDDKGVVVKTKAEILSLLSDNEPSLIESLSQTIGVNVLDEEGNPVTFEDNAEGIAAYVESVLDVKKEDIASAAINNLIESYPVLEGILAYLKVNGTLDGYETTTDYGAIELDVNNEAQLIDIVRKSLQVQNFKGNIDSYINYLKDGGTLADTAKEALETLKGIEADKIKTLNEQAAAAEAAEREAEKTYWSSIKEVVTKGEIAGYKIPDKVNITRGGRTSVASREDFYKYLSKPVKDGHSQYELDTIAVKPEDRMQDDVLRAYLRFTGSNYSSLVNMAINKERVASLRTTKNNSGGRTTKLTTKGNTKSTNNDLLLS